MIMDDVEVYLSDQRRRNLGRQRERVMRKNLISKATGKGAYATQTDVETLSADRLECISGPQTARFLPHSDQQKAANPRLNMHFKAYFARQNGPTETRITLNTRT
jgi:hypothetical protein